MLREQQEWKLENVQYDLVGIQFQIKILKTGQLYLNVKWQLIPEVQLYCPHTGI